MMGILRILFSVLLFFPVLGFALTPTPAQIEMFKKLSPDQQKALAKQYGVELPDDMGAASQPVTNPMVVQPREAEVTEKEVLPGADQSDQVLTPVADQNESESVSKKLKPFGYDLFAGTPTTFAPATDIPVPVDYIIGPGDTVLVQLYGKENTTHELAVNREGIIQFPEIGPISVAGQTFQELKTQITDTVSRQMIGIKASVTMGALRSIRIFVLGEAFRPGSYTVSSLATMTNALFYSGGIKEIGSLRKIQLKRKGQLISELDLYDLLLKGDTSSDKRLQPGDVIFIPAVGETVGVAGEVKRPGIYEIKKETTAKQIVELAGGYLPSAYPSDSKIERINKQGARTVLDLDLTTAKGKSVSIMNGDVLSVYSVLDRTDGVVTLSGHVYRPGSFAWKKGMRVSDLVNSYAQLLPNPDVKYALIKREQLPERKIKTRLVNLRKVLAQPGSNYDLVLQPRDELLVFGAEESREELLAKTISRVKSQSDFNNPEQLISIEGNVRFPGKYPLSKGMSVLNAVNAASGFGENTDLGYALLVREDAKSKFLTVTQLNLNQPASLRIKLSAKDTVYIFDLDGDRQELIADVLNRLKLQTSPNESLKIVSVSGLVRFPGDYPLVPGMRVADLVSAAGGYLESAYTIGAEITRSTVTDQKVQEFQRVEIDLGSEELPVLQARDQLYVKKIPNWAERETVSIQGEVNFPGIYPIFKGDTILDLIERAGGITEYGDPAASIFLREDLKRREQEQILKFKAQLEKDLAEMKLEAAQGQLAGQVENAEALSVGESMLQQLASAQASGRLVIDLDQMLSGISDQSIKLKDKDQLIIPRRATEVSVVGEVQFPTSHLYKNGLDVFEYVDISGGFTSKSDDDRIYVIKPSGKIIAVKNGWFFDSDDDVGPGDTVVVPYDTYSTSPLVYWSSMSQILFQLATTVAALQTVGVFN